MKLYSAQSSKSSRFNLPSTIESLSNTERIKIQMRICWPETNSGSLYFWVRTNELAFELKFVYVFTTLNMYGYIKKYNTAADGIINIILKNIYIKKEWNFFNRMNKKKIKIKDFKTIITCSNRFGYLFKEWVVFVCKYLTGSLEFVIALLVF